ncbi:MAG: hypothetical protein K1W20_06465 [Lachnospiraceae bacterium]
MNRLVRLIGRMASIAGRMARYAEGSVRFLFCSDDRDKEREIGWYRGYSSSHV